MNFEYIAQTFADYVSVREGRKPLLIVSSEKSTFAYEQIADFAEQDGLRHQCALLIGEDGDLHEHVLVSLPGAPYVREALELIDAVRCGRMSRSDMQMRMGMLLGYSAYEILEFIESHVGRTCKCDCCGGPNTVQDRTDGNPSRFVEFGYLY